MVVSCEVCKSKIQRGESTLDCTICKVSVHENCLSLTKANREAIQRNPATFKCKVCKTPRRLSIAKEAPTIVTIDGKLEDLSTFIRGKMSLMEQIAREVEKLSMENNELRQKWDESEAKKAQSDKRISELEEQVALLFRESENNKQRENLMTLEIQNVPDGLLQESLVDSATEVLKDALDVVVDSNEIVSAKVMKVGAERKSNMILLRLSNTSVKRRIVLARRHAHKANNFKGVFLKRNPHEGTRIFINERLTERGRALLREAKKLRKTLNFKFVWVDG